MLIVVLYFLFVIFNSLEEILDENYFNKIFLRCGRLFKCEGEVYVVNFINKFNLLFIGFCCVFIYCCN